MLSFITVVLLGALYAAAKGHIDFTIGDDPDVFM
jgi:hypothetical protein